MTNSHNKQVLIVRHGNTFLPSEPPRRIGGATDLPLVESERAMRIGHYLSSTFIPDVVYCSPLLRTRQTAEIALKAAQLEATPLIFDDRFIEIDYGPDENKIEKDVLNRIGQNAMDLWNEKAQVPQGWVLNIKALKESWRTFFKMIAQDTTTEKVLVITSNGIARFAPCILQENNVHDNLPHLKSLKMKTGHMSLFQKKTHWSCTYWNKNPLDYLKK